MSAASRSSGARRVSTPASGTSGFRKSVESTRRMPSPSSTRATAPISESVFFRGNENRSFANFQSGRIELKILLCLTCPAMTACVTPSLCIRSMALLNSPRLTQCSRFAEFSRSADASSFNAITAISMPWLRAPSNTRNGNRPFPAMSPQPDMFAPVIQWSAEPTCQIYLMIPRSAVSMNRMSSVTSGESASEARISPSA